MKIIYRKSNIFRWLFYLELYLIFILSGSAFISVEQSLPLRPYLNIAVNFIALIIGLQSLRKIKIYGSALLITIGLLTLFTVLGALNYSSSAISLAEDMLSFLLFLLMLIALNAMKVDYERTIYNLILIISVLSLAVFVLVVALKWNIPYTELGRGEKVYYRNYMMLYSWTYRYVKPWNSFDRITSMFWEPGIYAIYLNYALFYLLYRKKTRKWDSIPIVILCINIFLTYSTTGWMLAIILILFYLFSNTKYRKISYLLTAIIGTPIIIQLLLRKQSANAVSYEFRIMDLLGGLKLFANNAIFGIGYERIGVYDSFSDMIRGNSNGLVSWLYQNGMVGIIIMFAPFFILYKKLYYKDGKRVFMFFLITYLVCNMTEPLTARPFNRLIVSIILFMGISVRKNVDGEARR